MKNIKNSNTANENNIISYFLIGIYIFLALFFLITLYSPNWLKNAVVLGQVSEAKVIKNYGDNFMGKGDYDKAILQFKNAIIINPNFAEAYTNMGICYKLQGNIKEALNCFNKSISYEDKLHAISYFNIAEILNSKNKPTKAIKYFMKSAEIAPYPLESLQKIGELYSNIKQWDEATKYFDLALENTFSMNNCYKGMLVENYYMYEDEDIKTVLKEQINTGIEQIDFSDYDNKIFEEQAKNNRHVASIYNQYGYVFTQTNQLPKAAEYFQKAVTIFPDFEEAKKNLEYAKSLLNQK